MRGYRATTRFLEMPRPIYANDPLWVPPLRSVARRFMSPRKNPYFAEAEIDHFVAVDRGGRAVGRISATIDRQQILERSPQAFFGWFECEESDEVAAALLGHVEDWARQRGMESVAGPYSYCATQEFGLLVDGFDTEPAAFQPHNPPYYLSLLERAGYRETYTTDVYAWNGEDDRDALGKVAARGRAARERFGLTVRRASRRTWDADLEQLYALFVESFEDNHDMVPMSRPVFDFQAKDLKAFLDPDLIMLVEHDGRPIGFALLMADANEILAEADGHLSPGFLLRYRELRSAVSGTVVLMIGAAPRAVGMGVGRVLAGAIAEVALGEVGGYNRVHTSWIHQDNWQSRALVAGTGATSRRRYAVLAKDLGR